MKLVFGLSVVNALAMANEEAKEINANTERFGRLSIFFSSIVVLPSKASDAQTRASAGFQHVAVESVGFSCSVTISLSAFVIYIFTAAAMRNMSEVSRPECDTGLSVAGTAVKERDLNPARFMTSC